MLRPRPERPIFLKAPQQLTYKEGVTVGQSDNVSDKRPQVCGLQRIRTGDPLAEIGLVQWPERDAFAVRLPHNDRQEFEQRMQTRDLIIAIRPDDERGQVRKLTAEAP